LEQICGFVAAEQYGVMSAIPAKPVEVKNYIKHCEQRRKFPVLYKVEFQVSALTLLSICTVERILFVLDYMAAIYYVCRAERWKKSLFTGKEFIVKH
jgi:hypothetical protein